MRRFENSWLGGRTGGRRSRRGGVKGGGGDGENGRGEKQVGWECDQGNFGTGLEDTLALLDALIE